MKTKFDLLKNGKNATTVWANKTTKEIYPANKNSFGYNAEMRYQDEFYMKYGKYMKHNQGKSDRSKFYYSYADMVSAGFSLAMRGENPLW